MQDAVQRLLAEQACRDLVLAAADAVDGRDYPALAALFESDRVLVRPDGTEIGHSRRFRWMKAHFTSRPLRSTPSFFPGYRAPSSRVQARPVVG